jgi:hypothetical protein
MSTLKLFQIKVSLEYIQHDHINPLGAGEVLVHITSLNLPLFIDVPVPGQSC